MITQTVIVDINSGLGPYEYLVQASDCISFDSYAGTTENNFIELEYSTDSVYCLQTSSATITVITADGCPSILELPLKNPCESFLVSDIIRIEDFAFQVQSSSNNCRSVNVEWSWNENLFSLANQIDSAYLSTIYLEPNDLKGFPDTSVITATVTDCNGCIEERQLTFIICKPEITAKTVQLDCIDLDGGREPTIISPNFFFNVNSRCTTDIDWNTFSIQLPDRFFMLPGNADNSRRFRAQYPTPPGNYIATWTVADVNGIRSNTATLNLVVNDCDEDKTLVAADRIIQLGCLDITAGDTVPIDISDVVTIADGYTIDWDTFTVTNDPNPHVGINNINYRIDANGNRFIDYTTVNPILNDAFAWTVCDDGGNCLDAVVYAILGCAGPNPEPPIANNDEDICSQCGTPIIIDVLFNDTAPNSTVDTSTVVISTTPSNGNTAVVNQDGSITYTPAIDFSGEDEFGYRFKNTDDMLSNEGRVHLIVQCAGQSSGGTIVCNV